MARNSHNCARTVAREHEVTDEHTDFLAVYGIYAGNALELTARLGLVELGAVHVVLLLCLLDVCLDLFAVLYAVEQARGDVAVGSEYHECDAVDSLDAGGEYRELAAADNVELDLNTSGLAYPVPLHGLRGLGPVYLVEPLKELLGEGGLVDDPLLHILADYRIAAALGLVVDDLVVREHRAELLAPVDGHIYVLCIAVEVELLEYPLSPLVELGVGGSYHL